MARLFGFLTVLIGLGVGGYFCAHSTASTGTGSPKTTVNLTEVRTDLLTIAQAERGYFALEGKYASLDDLISNKSLNVPRARATYSYEIQTGSQDFRVIATRSRDDTSGAPAQLSVDENMHFQISQ
jgi:hypothetical protein